MRKKNLRKIETEKDKSNKREKEKNATCTDERYQVSFESYYKNSKRERVHDDNNNKNNNQQINQIHIEISESTLLRNASTY